MKFDPTKPVRTRDGREARIICTDRKGAQSILALVPDDDGDECAEYFDVDGRYYKSAESGYDLINIPERVSRFANVYRDCDVGASWKTKEEVPDFGEGRIAVLEIIFEGDMPVETIIHTDV